MIYKFFDKKSAGSGMFNNNNNTNNDTEQKLQLPQELQESIIRKF